MRIRHLCRGDDGKPVPIANVLTEAFEAQDEETRMHQERVEHMRRQRKQGGG